VVIQYTFTLYVYIAYEYLQKVEYNHKYSTEYFKPIASIRNKLNHFGKIKNGHDDAFWNDLLLEITPITVQCKVAFITATFNSFNKYLDSTEEHNYSGGSHINIFCWFNFQIYIDLYYRYYLDCERDQPITVWKNSNRSIFIQLKFKDGRLVVNHCGRNLYTYSPYKYR